MMHDDFGTKSRALLDWFKSQPGATFHQYIRLADMRDRGAGRGIVATADIEADTVLLTIPRSRIICTATTELASRIPSALVGSVDEGDMSLDDSPHDSWTSLILIMIYEYLRGDESPWKAYLDALPTCFDTPMFWTETELEELQATSVASMIGRDEADRMIATKILPVIRAHADVFFGRGGTQEPLSDVELMSLAHRMGSTIMAYAFDLAQDSGSDNEDSDEGGADGWVEDSDGKGVLGMVPMADMLNADADFNAHVSHEEGALVVTALRKIAAGEEVLNYYGPVSNGELLRRYGYVTRAHQRWDAVELPWKLVATRTKGQLGIGDETWAKAEKLVDGVGDVEDGFVIEWGSEDPDASGHVSETLEFRGLPDELADQVKAFFKALRKVDPNGAGETLQSSEKRREIYLTCVLGALGDRIAEYETSLEQDLLRREQQNPAGRAGKALEVRIGEKILLREAQNWVRDKQQELGQAGRDTDGPATKRQRYNN